MIKKIDWLIGSLIAGIMVLSAIIVPAIPIMAGTPVDLVLVPAEQTIRAGETFDVVIQAQSGSQQVIGVDAYLDFDPIKLAVVDMNSEKPGIQISGGTTLSLPLWNSANNSTGHIDYSAGAFSPYPHGTFTLATIRFLAMAATTPTTTVIFSTSFERPTTVIGDTQASDVTGTLMGGNYTFKPAITSPVPTEGGSAEAGGNGGNVVQPINTSGLLTVAIPYPASTVTPTPTPIIPPTVVPQPTTPSTPAATAAPTPPMTIKLTTTITTTAPAPTMPPPAKSNNMTVIIVILGAIVVMGVVTGVIFIRRRGS
jgi:hypothetical protein